MARRWAQRLMAAWLLATIAESIGSSTVRLALRKAGRCAGTRHRDAVLCSTPGRSLSSRDVDAVAIGRLRGGSSPTDYSKMKLSDLQKELRGRGLSTKGLKHELIERLQGAAPSDDEVPTASKRDAPEPTDDGTEDEHARQKQAAIAGEAEDQGEGEENHAEPVPVPIAAPPRVHVDASAEGLVKVYNSYAIKDKCRAAGFQFDAAERAWVKPSAAVLEQLEVASLEHVTCEAVLDLIQNTDEAGAAVATPTKEPEACRAEVQNGMVRISGGTYGIKDKLRLAGFKWDADSYSWARAEPEVTSWINELRAGTGAHAVEAGSSEYADAVLAAVTELDESAQVKPAVDPVKPQLVVKEDKVFVYNSYDIKDKLRALGFRFSSAERAWSRSLEAVLELSPEFDTGDDVTLDKLLVLDAPELDDDGPPPPSLRIVDEDVEVYDSYSIKDQLRALGFRWNADKTCWTHTVDQVKEALGVETQDEITVDLCTAVGEHLASTGEGANKQKPELRVEGDEVQVFKSYDVKEKLRALGFSWSTEQLCWRINADKLLERIEGCALETLTIDDVLALEPLPDEAKEAASLVLSDGEALVYNSYDIKEKLRTLNFRWDSSRGVWTQPVEQVMAAVGVEDESLLTLDKILAAEAPAQEGGEAKMPHLTLDDLEVCVFNSYDVKDKLRALGFHWDSARVAWTRPTAEVLAMLSVPDKELITMHALLNCNTDEFVAAADDAGNLVGAAGASLEMLNDEVRSSLHTRALRAEASRDGAEARKA
jgi:hypothetical protein